VSDKSFRNEVSSGISDSAVGDRVTEERPSRNPLPKSSETEVSQSARVKLRYRPDIAGLRGIGVIIIVLAHANIGFLRNGFIFVDAFYVVSGFLITGLLAKEYERSATLAKSKSSSSTKRKKKRKSPHRQISLKNFYVRRAQRILPAALFVAWTTVALARLLFNSTKVAAVTSDALWATFFGANVHFMAQATDYFQFGEQTSPLQHYWSLSIEEQFYSVWPLLFTFATGLPVLKIFGTRLSWRNRLTVVLGSVTSLSFVWMFISFHLSPLSTYFSTTARAWELGLGGLVAINLRFAEKLSYRTREFLSWFATLAFSLSMVFVTPSNFGYTLWVPVFSIALLLGIGHGDRQPYILRLISAKFLQVMGLLSYAIYLWHWPVFTFARDLGYLTNWWQTALAILISFLLAVVTYFLVERPFHSLKWKPNATSQKMASKESTSKRRRGGPTVSVANLDKLADIAVKRAANRRTWVHTLRTFLAAVLALSMVLVLPKIAEVQEQNASASGVYVPQNAIKNMLAGLDTRVSETHTEAKWHAKVEAALKLKTAPKSLLAQLGKLSAQKIELFNRCLDPSYEDPNSGCSVGSTSKNAHLAVVIGDSTALSIAPTVAGALDLTRWRVLILTRHICPVAQVVPLIDGKPDLQCLRHRENVFQRLRKLQPDMIFLSEGSAAATFQTTHMSKVMTWSRGLARSLARLKAITPSIVIFFEPPLTPAAVECVGKNGEVTKCFGRDTQDLDFLSATQRISDQYRAKLEVPARWLCLSGICPAIIDKTAVKFDRTHINIDMAKKLAPLLRLDLIKAGMISSKR
jgi:peptidoglycan/LPS O-acetylase OafA/YrhL